MSLSFFFSRARRHLIQWRFGAELYARRLHRATAFLSNQTDLSPGNPNLNAIIAHLVEETTKRRSRRQKQAILRRYDLKKIAPNLRALFGQAEYEIERFCSVKISKADHVVEGLSTYGGFQDFNYLDDYTPLLEREISLCSSACLKKLAKNKQQSIAFVGAGPFPLSAIILYLKTKAPIVCIEKNSQACANGCALLNKLAQTKADFCSLPHAIRYVQADGRHYDYANHPLCFVASLVNGKNEVLARFAETAPAAARAIVRSVEGLGRFLYEPYEPKTLPGLKFKGAKRATRRSINSSLLWQIERQTEAR